MTPEKETVLNPLNKVSIGTNTELRIPNNNNNNNNNSTLMSDLKCIVAKYLCYKYSSYTWSYCGNVSVLH